MGASDDLGGLYHRRPALEPASPCSSPAAPRPMAGGVGRWQSSGPTPPNLVDRIVAGQYNGDRRAITMTLLDAVFRVVLALIVGGLVGVERELRDIPAGMRTHMLVCAGSTLITLVSSHMAPANFDPT